jgi:PiT family inorganic phosphate transporter
VQITPAMIFAGLMGAIVWNLVTWLRGLPSSSSHALFGGLIGAAVVGAGVGSVDFGVVMSKVILPALLAPVIAGLIAYTTTKLAYSITRRSSGPNERGGFRYGQIFTSSLVALAHGTNDAQKTMGIITLTLIAGGFQAAGSGPEFWVIAVCAVAIALGTYMGGWRIIRTMGSGLTEVKPAQGFSAEASTAATILASSHLGFALSTTQVASGSVIGSGLGRRGASVRWNTVGKIALGWLLTLPSAAIVGAIAAFVASTGTIGFLVDAVVGVAVIVWIFWRSRRNAVHARNAIVEVDAAGFAVRGRKATKAARKAREAA